MSESVKDRGAPEPASANTGGEPQAHASRWQWLFIGILLACWLAEATLCAATGY